MHVFVPWLWPLATRLSAARHDRMVSSALWGLSSSDYLLGVTNAWFRPLFTAFRCAIVLLGATNTYSFPLFTAFRHANICWADLDALISELRAFGSGAPRVGP